MKKIINHLRINRVRYILALIFFLFIGGVSFRQIWDKHTRKRKDKIEYIVIHYTANPHAGADAEMNARYLQKKRNAGAHYVIDDQEIIQTVPENEVAYSVGDKKWLGFIPKPWLKGKVFNENSISYEMCLGGGRNDSLIIERTAQCVAWQILNKGFFRLDSVRVWSQSQNRTITLYKKVPDLGRVIRHHDVSGKQCPRFYYMDPSWDQKKEDRAFYIFKLKVDTYVRKKLEVDGISAPKTRTQ